ILEVNTSRVRTYGINLNQYSVGAVFSPEVAPSGTATPFNLNTVTRGISTADFFMSVPQAVANFLATDSTTRLISRPQLRGAEGQKLTLNLGDEVPVPSTVFTPIATGGAATNPLTSFTYKPVGVNLEITPRVTYDGEIILDVTVESSNIGDSIDIAGQSLPTFGSRKATTRLRLREGESNLLAGLIRRDELKRLRGIPGIMNLPFFKQVFSSNDNTEGESDIVILITPRIIRTHELTADNLAPIFIGTQQNVGLGDGPRLLDPAGEPVIEAPAAPPASPPVGAAPLQPRVPEGTTPRPTLPVGSSPIPGTTTAPVTPPAAPAAPAPQPQTQPEPQGLQGGNPPPVAPPVAAAPAVASVAQVVLSTPGTEFRPGAGPFTVPISVNGASRFSVVSLSLSFNPAVLRVRAVQEGSFLRQGGVQVTFTQQADATTGRVDISLARTGDSVGASGSGLLAAVLFEAVATGTSPLSVSGVATNPEGGPVPIAFQPVSIAVK
ncbi:MAG: cohesin domain-containing protein, partial [Vicinamibacterales bacterium]